MQKPVSFEIDIKENIAPKETQMQIKERLEERKKQNQYSDEKTKLPTDAKLQQAEEKRMAFMMERKNNLKQKYQKKTSQIEKLNEMMEEKSEQLRIQITTKLDKANVIRQENITNVVQKCEKEIAKVIEAKGKSPKKYTEEELNMELVDEKM